MAPLLPTSLGAPLRIDCGFRNLSSWACYLVFKDRAACCHRDFVLPFSPPRRYPFQPRGCLLYFEAVFLSSGRCRSVSPLLPFRTQHRATALCFLLPGRGAEPTSFPPPLSTPFVDSFFPPGSPSSPPRLPPSRGAAASTTSATRVNPASLTSYSVFQPVRKVPAAHAASPSRPGGAPSTPPPHHRQPSSSSPSSFRLGIGTRGARMLRILT